MATISNIGKAWKKELHAYSYFADDEHTNNPQGPSKNSKATLASKIISHVVHCCVNEYSKVITL